MTRQLTPTASTPSPMRTRRARRPLGAREGAASSEAHGFIERALRTGITALERVPDGIHTASIERPELQRFDDDTRARGALLVALDAAHALRRGDGILASGDSAIDARVHGPLAPSGDVAIALSRGAGGARAPRRNDVAGVSRPASRAYAFQNSDLLHRTRSPTPAPRSMHDRLDAKGPTSEPDEGATVAAARHCAAGDVGLADLRRRPVAMAKNLNESGVDPLHPK